MRQLADWLLAYLEYTKEQEAPELFHVWSGISALAATVGRNCWLDRGFYTLFPNHYIILVARSALCRKSVAVGIAVDILEKAKVCEISAERITNASLLTELANVAQKTGRSEMLVFADELAIFLSKEETHKGIITTLTRMFGCPSSFINKLKTVPTDELKNVCLNILAATTPSDLAELIPMSATGKGFTPRLHIIYQESPRFKKADPKKNIALELKLCQDLQEIKKVQGQFKFSSEGQEWWDKWYLNMGEPILEDLDGYYGRKHDYMLKLAMLVSLSYKNELFLFPEDMEKSSALLNQMEVFIPTAYKAIGTNPSMDHIDRVVRQIERKGGRMTKSEVLRANWNRFTAREWVEIAFHLQESGMIDVLPGRPTVYVLKKGGEKK